MHSGVTFEGRPHLTLGGVGRNLATALEFLGHKPTFVTSLASDNLASFALDELRASGFGHQTDDDDDRLSISWISRRMMSELNIASSCFALVLMDSISGQCELVIANLDAAKAIDGRAVERLTKRIANSPLLVMDANLPGETGQLLLQLCHQNRVPVFVEPTDVACLPSLISTLKQQQSRPILFLSPNLLELDEILRLYKGETGCQQSEQSGASIERVADLAKRLMTDYLPQLKCLLVTMDKRGALVAIRGSRDENIDRIQLMGQSNGGARQSSISGNSDDILVKHFKPPELIERPVSASGAGDSFAAGFISGLLDRQDVSVCLDRAFKAAAKALADCDTISRGLRELEFVRNKP